MYKKDIGVPLGAGLFWAIVAPQIVKITTMVGCAYIYLFAADESNDESRKLIKYYKRNLNFTDKYNSMIIEPHYDRNCIGMIQSIDNLQDAMSGVWSTLLTKHI